MKHLLIEDNIDLAASKFLNHYKESFKRLYGEEPSIDDNQNSDDLVTARWAILKYDLEKAKALVSTYLVHEDKWLKEQGYPLKLFRRTLNAMFVKNAGTIKGFKTHWVVGITDSGKPVVDYDQFVMGQDYWYKPVPWNKWISQSNEERLQKRFSEVKEERKEAVSEWFLNWDLWKPGWSAYEGE